MSRGKTVFKKGYGLASLETAEKVGSGTVFNIASLTKQFTAMAIRQLVAENKCTLEDSIGKFLPNLPHQIGSQVQLRHLLSHGSGIPDHYTKANTQGRKHANDRDVLAAVRESDSLLFTPGTRFRYSNTAFCLLSLVIEKISGTPYPVYLQQKVLQPAGMQKSYIWQPGLQGKKMATGYDHPNEAGDSLQWIPSGPDQHIFFSTEGDGGLCTTVDDYVKWMQYWQTRLPLPVIQNDISGRAGYGSGWFIDKGAGSTRYYHSGSNGGFRSYCFLVPGEEFGLVLFSNRSDRNIEALAAALLNILRPEAPPLYPIQALTN